MRTPGPVDPSLKLVDAGAGRSVGQEAGLKAGAVVSVVVREKLGGELYRVSIGRELLTASSSSPLELGTVLKARVERSSAGLLLRIATKEDSPLPRAFAAAEAAKAANAASLLAAAGLPNDQAARAALAALLREGMAPEARALARVRRAALRDGESGGEGAELAAKMEAKGMSAEEEALGELLSFMGGRGGGGRGRGHGRGEGRGEEEEVIPPRDQASSGLGLPESLDPGKDFRADVPEGELPPFLAGLFRAICFRSGGDCDPLSLFNHLRGPEGSWVIVPFRFGLDAVDFAGSFRIQLPYVRGGQGRFEAFFSASRGPAAEDWSFFAGFGGGRAPSLRIDPPRGGAAESLARSGLDRLAAELAAYSCSVRMGERGGDQGAGGLDLDA
jgi:hypothetical protein